MNFKTVVGILSKISSGGFSKISGYISFGRAKVFTIIVIYPLMSISGGSVSICNL